MLSFRFKKINKNVADTTFNKLFVMYVKQTPVEYSPSVVL